LISSGISLFVVTKFFSLIYFHFTHEIYNSVSKSVSLKDMAVACRCICLYASATKRTSVVHQSYRQSCNVRVTQHESGLYNRRPSDGNTGSSHWITYIEVIKSFVTFIHNRQAVQIQHPRIPYTSGCL
jgi:hypothetical protein